VRNHRGTVIGEYCVGGLLPAFLSGARLGRNYAARAMFPLLWMMRRLGSGDMFGHRIIG
jgi:hypothetical protein